MKIFARFDANGLPLGFWNNDVFPDQDDGERNAAVPSDAVVISQVQHLDFLEGNGLRRWNFETGRVNNYTPPGPTPEEVAAAQRLALFPNLEPDRFWFGMRAAGYEEDVRAWVASLNDPESPDYNPVTWASASAKLEFAKFFEHDHALVRAAQVAIGISEAELDALWQFAAFG